MRACASCSPGSPGELVRAAGSPGDPGPTGLVRPIPGLVRPAGLVGSAEESKLFCGCICRTTYGVKGSEISDFGGSSLEPPRPWLGALL